GDTDRDELQQHAQPHQPLRSIWRTAPHHVDEAHHQDQGDGADRDGKDEFGQDGTHRRYITPPSTLRHVARCSFTPTIWLFMPYYQMLTGFGFRRPHRGKC